MSEAFNLQRLKAEGRSHWRQHLPKLYAQLQSAGKLESALTEAAEKTRKQMDQMNQAGQTDAEAWPDVRGQWLILDPATAEV